MALSIISFCVLIWAPNAGEWSGMRPVHITSLLVCSLSISAWVTIGCYLATAGAQPERDERNQIACKNQGGIVVQTSDGVLCVYILKEKT